jgi:hypothetical protein
MPDHSVVHRYARCLSYPEWGVGHGRRDLLHRRRRRSSSGRACPSRRRAHGAGGSLQFVDFSKPDPGAERVQRFMTARQHAHRRGRLRLAAQRLIYARDAEPDERRRPAPDDPGLLAGRRYCPRPAAPCATGLASTPERPAAHRFAARIYEDMGAIRPLRRGGRPARAARAPQDADGWERVGRLRLRLWTYGCAGGASARAPARPGVEGLLDLALAYHLAGTSAAR